jgi:hypothetical protein
MWWLAAEQGRQQAHLLLQSLQELLLLQLLHQVLKQGQGQGSPWLLPTCLVELQVMQCLMLLLACWAEQVQGQVLLVHTNKAVQKH